MKHLFIINPTAGKYDHTDELRAAIEKVFAPSLEPWEIQVSKTAGDCSRIAREAAKRNPDLRVYACGGDGTLNEVVNGVIGFDNAAITVLPFGSGNDFVRIFSNPDAFRDVSNFLSVEESVFDLLCCQKQYFSINISSVGLDARVGTEMTRYKHWPMVSGSMAYMLSIFVNLIKGTHWHYRMELDGKKIDDDLTAVCVANGRCYGGGFQAVPDAEPDDGLLDVLFVSKASRIKLASVIDLYKQGRYKERPDLFHHYRCKKIVIHCDKPQPVSLDGELLMEKDITFELSEYKVRFFYPKGLTYSLNAPVTNG